MLVCFGRVKKCNTIIVELGLRHAYLASALSHVPFSNRLAAETPGRSCPLCLPFRSKRHQ